MKKFLILFVLLYACNQQSEKSEEKDFITVFESSEGFKTATYHETIRYYSELAESYPQISLHSMGETDSGEPLHVVIYNPDANNISPESLHENHKVLLINNGIHPGESDGIDATMMLFRDLAQGTIKSAKETVIVTIPIYNVGGSLNRNSGTRTNQNGPESYGFRGNAQNYDLNRDFIKADTKNAKSFAKILHRVKPDMFIDNHVSNGADYQYTLTHLFTQHNKLGGVLGAYVHETLMPKLESSLLTKEWDITPYVNVFNRTPESGFSQFMDYPRYSTGYTSLFNIPGLMVETHMLKPYKKRVEGTYELMKSMITILNQDGQQIRKLREQQGQYWKTQNFYPVQWALDTSKQTVLNFKGYEGNYVESNFTGGQRLKYDRAKPFTKPVTYSNYFKKTDSIDIPKAYIIPQGWHKVIDRIKENNISFKRFKKDTTITVESYRIDSYDTRRSPYEGHYGHYNTKVSKSEKLIEFRQGDYIIETNQAGIRYIIETLEPQAVDSFFNWNFFDTVLQQKEGFSPYVWEDKAEFLLKSRSKLQIDFNLKKSYDPEFAKNWYAQLEWLHKQSENYEKAHMQYPVYRIAK